MLRATFYEQEADRVADVVTRALTSKTQRQEEEEEVQAQHQVEEEEEIQARSEVNRPKTVSENLETRINNARSSGQPLSDNIREPMEKALRADFSGVRLHINSEAAILNKELNAKAFTTGQDIFFLENEYSPSSDIGRKLIAHELTHVVQQTGRNKTRRQKNLKENNVEKAAPHAQIRMTSLSVQKIEDIPEGLVDKYPPEILEHYEWDWSKARQKLVYEAIQETRGLGIMNRLIKYRQHSVNSVVDEVVLGLSGKKDVKRTLIKDGIKYTIKNTDRVPDTEITSSAPGSTKPTSDYDITFTVKDQPDLEVDLVEAFNDKFGAKWEGKPSAVVFDTNVYTSGFMSEEARKTYTNKLDPERSEKVEENRMVSQLALSLLPICQHIIRNYKKEKKESRKTGWNVFRIAVKADLRDYIKYAKENTVITEAQKAYAEDITDKVLLRTEVIFDETESKIGKAKEGIVPGGKTDEINKLNKLYQEELEKVKQLLIGRKTILGKLAEKPTWKLKNELAENLKNFEITQGKALVYAQEAYYCAGAAIHVVEGMQTGGTIVLLPNQKLQSILMNIGYKLQHYTEQKKEEVEEEKGKAEMATGKYGQRIKHENVWDEAHYLDKAEPLLDMEIGLVKIKNAKEIRSPRMKLTKAKEQKLSYESLELDKPIEEKQQGEKKESLIEGPGDFAMEMYIAMAVEAIAPYLISEFKQRSSNR